MAREVGIRPRLRLEAHALRGALSLLRHLVFVRPSARRSGLRDPVFIVGCGHSGTSLLQAILASHPEVFGVRGESRAFAIGDHRAGVPLLHTWLMRDTFSTVNNWYAEAQQADRTVIVEKTPKHVHALGPLLRLWPRSQVVLVVREPLDVIASLVRRGFSLEEATLRWDEDNRAALPYMRHARVRLFRYEEFVQRPSDVLDSLLTRLGLSPDPSLLDRYWRDAAERPPAERSRTTPHRALRERQIQMPVFDGRRTWNETLDPATARAVAGTAAALRSELGYPDEVVGREAGNSDEGPSLVDCRLIVDPDMLSGDEGSDISGPCLIRVPKWVAQPLGRYYLYFAHHAGAHIRMAYSDDLRGPWRIRHGGVLHVGEVAAASTHIASPDVLVDEQNKVLRMYFHVGSPRDGLGQNALPRAFQPTLVAESRDGLSFRPDDPPVVLGPFYFRVFERMGEWFAFAKGGELYTSQSPDSPFTFVTNPFLEHEHAQAAHGGFFNEPGDIRHVGLDVRGDEAFVYFSRIGDVPERILRAHINLDGEPDSWRASDPVEVHRPHSEWEGAALPLAASKPGRGAGHNLRDPYLFREAEHCYLVYAVKGGSGLALAELREAQGHD